MTLHRPSIGIKTLARPTTVQPPGRPSFRTMLLARLGGRYRALSFRRSVSCEKTVCFSDSSPPSAAAWPFDRLRLLQRCLPPRRQAVRTSACPPIRSPGSLSTLPRSPVTSACPLSPVDRPSPVRLLPARRYRPNPDSHRDVSCRFLCSAHCQALTSAAATGCVDVTVRIYSHTTATRGPKNIKAFKSARERKYHARNRHQRFIN